MGSRTIHARYEEFEPTHHLAEGRLLRRVPYPRHEPRELRTIRLFAHAIVDWSSRAGTAIAIGVAPPGSSSSLAFGGWAIDHFVKPFAPLAFRKIFIIAIHLSNLSRKGYGDDF
jgi:hypothetical protein